MVAYFSSSRFWPLPPLEVAHPTRSTAAIVVSRRCFIESYLGRGTDEGVGI